MRKTAYFILLMTAVLSLSACGNGTVSSGSSAETMESATKERTYKKRMTREEYDRIQRENSAPVSINGNGLMNKIPYEKLAGKQVSFGRSDTAPDGNVETIDITADRVDGSTSNVAMWVDGNKVLWYSPEDRVGVTDADDMFHITIDGQDSDNETLGMNLYSSVFTDIDLTGLDFSKCLSMDDMFACCSGLKSLDLSMMDTSYSGHMKRMFESCWSLEDLNISGFDTHGVVDMTEMFGGCTSLKNIDVSSFNTSRVISMAWMFSNCPKIETLDLSSFDTSKVQDMGGMFTSIGESRLKTIYVSDKFVTDSAMDGPMFGNCVNIVGGAGTRYRFEDDSIAYARIDGGTANPGYFTAKS